MDKMFTLGVVLSATDMLSPVMGRANASVGKLATKIQAVSGKMAIAGTAAYGAGRAMLSSVMDTVNAYNMLAQAQGEIASLGIGAAGIDAITKSAKEFSSQFAGTSAPDFIKASYDIKSGISTLSDTAVGEFTKMAAMTGAATKSTTAEMTKLFALGHGIFRKDFGDDVQFATQFSGAISGAVQAFRTDGADLTQGLSNIGAAAASMGITLAEELSIIGVAKGSFDSASEAATGYRAFLDNVGKAQGKLGIEFTDSAGKMLPMVEILQRIQDNVGDLSVVENSDMLKEAFGSAEAVKIIKSLIDKKEDLTSAQKTLNSHMKNGTKLTTEMALAMNKGKEFEIMSEQFTNLSSTIGEMFAPAVSSVAIVVGDMVTSISEWTSENKTAAKVIGYTVGGLGALLTVVGAILIPVAAIGMAMPMLAAGFTIVSVAIAFMGTALATVGKIFLMNPIGLIITGIGLAALVIYKYWEPISGFFTGLWEGVKGIFGAAANFIGSIFDGIFSSIMSKIELVGGWMKTARSWFNFSGGDAEMKSASASSTKITAVPAKQIAGISDTPKIKTMATATAEAASMTNTNSSTSSVKIDKIEINNPSSDVDVVRAINRDIESKRNRSYEDQEI